MKCLYFTICESKEKLSQMSVSTEPDPRSTVYPAFSVQYFTNTNKETFICQFSQNLHISCVGLWVYLTSELLKLPHTNTSKDFNLAQQSANGVTGSFKHTNEFHKTKSFEVPAFKPSCNLL